MEGATIEQRATAGHRKWSMAICRERLKRGYFAICVGGLIFQNATRALYVVR
jgi:hypothetical protein